MSPNLKTIKEYQCGCILQSDDEDPFLVTYCDMHENVSRMSESEINKFWGALHSQDGGDNAAQPQ